MPIITFQACAAISLRARQIFKMLAVPVGRLPMFCANSSCRSFYYQSLNQDCQTYNLWAGTSLFRALIWPVSNCCKRGKAGAGTCRGEQSCHAIERKRVGLRDGGGNGMNVGKEEK